MFNVLENLSISLRQWLDQNGESLDVHANMDLVAEGKQPDLLYILLSGKAQVITSQGSQSIELVTLESGEMFGEMSFIEDRPPVATIRTGSDCKVLRISREQLKSALTANPAVSRDFYKLIGQKLASQLTIQNQFIHRWPGIDVEPIRKVLIVFSLISEVDIEWLSKRGDKLSYNKGDIIIKESGHVPGLLIVLAGDAEVSILRNGLPTTVGSSRRGEFLGEMTLLGTSDTATASVQASTDMEILEISKSTLEAEFQQNLKFASRFYNSLAVLLSQRLRDQLRSRGMATRAFAAEEIDDESMSLEQMSSITTAGQRFNWLCQNIL